MKITTIRQALQYVADHPQIETDVLLDLKVHELVSRTLFEIANEPNLNSRGSMTRANVARSMILNRLVGKRRTGSHPATRQRNVLTFSPLAGELEDE